MIAEKYMEMLILMKLIFVSVLDFGAGLIAIIAAFDWWSIDGLYKAFVILGVVSYLGFRSYYWFFKARNEHKKYNHFEEERKKEESDG